MIKNMIKNTIKNMMVKNMIQKYDISVSCKKDGLRHSVQKLLLANFCRVATCGRGLARDARDARDARAADEKRR